MKQKFKGWDWTELAERWDLINQDEEYNEEQIAAKCREYMSKSLMSDKEKEVANDIREFLDALRVCSQHHDFCWPVWTGLRFVKSDFTLIQFTIILLDSMWS